MICVENISRKNALEMSNRSCDLCFEVADDMRCHMRDAHEDSRGGLGFFCHECDIFCPTLTEIIRHQCTEKPYTLKRSDERKKDKLKKIVKKGLKQIVQKSLKSVLTQRFKSSTKSCDICFFKSHDLNNHMKVSHESSEEVLSYSCPECGKLYSQLMDRMKHKCSYLLEKKSDECLLLEKSEIKVDSKEIQIHDEFVGDKGNPDFDFPKCDVCQKIFEEKDDLVRHTSLKHQFPCKICFSKFPLMLAAHHDINNLQDGWLQGHMRTTHTLQTSIVVKHINSTAN